jgi:hypothetical protein
VCGGAQRSLTATHTLVGLQTVRARGSGIAIPPPPRADKQPSSPRNETDYSTHVLRSVGCSKVATEPWSRSMDLDDTRDGDRRQGVGSLSLRRASVSRHGAEPHYLGFCSED